MVPAPEGRQAMAHTFANLLTHVIFSTKDRQPLLTPDLRTDLLAYMGGIVRNIHGKLNRANVKPSIYNCFIELRSWMQGWVDEGGQAWRIRQKSFPTASPIWQNERRQGLKPANLSHWSGTAEAG